MHIEQSTACITKICLKEIRTLVKILARVQVKPLQFNRNIIYTDFGSTYYIFIYLPNQTEQLYINIFVFIINIIPSFKCVTSETARLLFVS